MRVKPGEVRLAPMDGEVESFEVRILSCLFPFRSSSNGGCTAFAARRGGRADARGEFGPDCAVGALRFRF